MRKKNVIFLIFVHMLLLLMCYSAFSQTTGRISGVITDQETGEPLVGANVIVEGTSYGDATDDEGEYFILNVPVGTHAVTATYMGYKATTIENIVVNIGLTTRLNIELAKEAVKGEKVTIVAEKKLIQKTSTNTVRAATAEEIKNLPTRGANAVANLQPGVVSQDGNLYIRGGRDASNIEYVDGAAVRDVVSGNNRSSVIHDALEQVQVQTGGYNAKYGGATSGLISMAMKSGTPDYQFSVRAETDNFADANEKFLGTYSYGYSDYVLTASGPLPVLDNKIKFFFAGENEYFQDRYQRFWGPFELIDDQTELSDGTTFQFHDTGARGGTAGDSVESMIWEGNVIPNGASSNRFRYNGVLTADLQELKFRLSMSGMYRKFENMGDPFGNYFSRDPMGVSDVPDRTPTNFQSDMTITGKVTHVLSPETFYEVSLMYHDFRYKNWDPVFKSNYWAYNDSVAAAEKGITFHDRYKDPRSYDFYGFPINRPGNRESGYGYGKRNYYGGSFNFTHRYKRHEIQVGGDLQLWTVRNFASLSGQATYFYLRQNPDLVNNIDELEDYFRTVSANTYGYDDLGNETDSGLSSFDQARKPIMGSAYLQDQYEWKDLVVNAGLRIDYYDMDQMEPNNYEDPALSSETKTLVDSGYTSVDPFVQVSPRLGFGIPVTDNTKFHMQWGKFVQMPQMANVYRSESNLAIGMLGGFFYTNPRSFRVDPETTTQYEMGFEQMIGRNASLDLTLYYRDIENQLQTQRIFTASDAEVGAYDITTNGDFATTMGFELRFTMRRTNRLMGWFNYTYADARGTGSYLNQNSASLDQATNQISIISPLYFNHTHEGSINLDYRFAKGDGGPILEQMGLNMLLEFNSGHPYTLSGGGIGQNDASIGGTLSDTDARNRIPLEPVGSSTTPWAFTIDARLNKVVSYGRFDFDFYVYAQNLLNTKNIINVFPRTGTDNDGFLNDPELSGSVIEASGGAGYALMYHYLNDLNRRNYLVAGMRGNDLWNTPRQLRFGVLINYR